MTSIVEDILALYAFEQDDLMPRAVGVETLPESWRGYFRHQLEKKEAEGDT